MDRHGIRKASELSREDIRRCSARCAGKLDAMAEALEVFKPALKLRMKELDLRQETGVKVSRSRGQCERRVSQSALPT